jgi:hypothetical protein
MKRAGLISLVVNFVEMKAAGRHALDPQEPPTSTVNILNIDKNFGNAAQGSHINQTVNVNPEFDSAIKSLLEIVNTSTLNEHDKEELTNDIKQINKVALREPEEGIAEKANRRLDWVKTALAGGNLLIAASPHIDKIWMYFKVKYNL